MSCSRRSSVVRPCCCGSCGGLGFWNAQYLLEAFLAQNRDWKVIGALNLLHHRYHDRLAAVCPFLRPDAEPGSFYLERLG